VTPDLFANLNNEKMKRSATILFLTFLSKLAFGQIDENLSNSNWQPGEEKTLYGNKILRHSGKNDIGGMTNVGYENLTQVKANLEKKADSEMWTPEKKKIYIGAYEKSAAGGMIYLYLTRLTIEAANTNMFTIIVRDSTDSIEIIRKELEYDIPNTPPIGSDYWSNYDLMPIRKEFSGRVYVYIIDRLGGENNKFKFELIN